MLGLAFLAASGVSPPNNVGLVFYVPSALGFLSVGLLVKSPPEPLVSPPWAMAEESKPPFGLF